jgi:hypothetical protein
MIVYCKLNVVCVNHSQRLVSHYFRKLNGLLTFRASVEKNGQVYITDFNNRAASAE